jgi:GTP-binding protein Era
VACIGRPNVGKSTLLNRLLGEKLAIVSSKPQTTSRRLRGILNAPEGQIVIVDTPGIHAGEKAINRSLVREARRGLEGADAVLAVTDPFAAKHAGEEELMLETVRAAGLPAVLALNKADLVPEAELAARLAQAREAGAWREALAFSALTGRNVEGLLAALWRVVPPGEPLYPDDILSDQPEREFFAEMIREQIFHALHQELPYSAAVVIEEVLEQEQPRRYRVTATLYVERDSQKGMLIGQGGGVLKRIGAAARLEMERLTGAPVFLGLWVKVRHNWTKDERSLREFGFIRE